MLEKERKFAGPAYQAIKEYITNVLKGCTYKQMDLTKIFKGKQTHKAGEITTVALLPAHDDKKT